MMIKIMPTAITFVLMVVLPGTANGLSYPDRQCQGDNFPDPLNIRKCWQRPDVCGQAKEGSSLGDGKLTEGELTGAAQNLGRCLVNAIAEDGQWIIDLNERIPTQEEVKYFTNKIQLNFMSTSRFTLCAQKGRDLKEKWSESSRVHNAKLLLDVVTCLVEKDEVFKSPTLWKTFVCSACEAVLKRWAPPVSTVLQLVFESALACTFTN